MLISSYFTTIPGGQALEETKLRLTQPSLIELGLGLRLAIPYYQTQAALKILYVKVGVETLCIGLVE